MHVSAVVPKSTMVWSWRTVLPDEMGMTVAPMAWAPWCTPNPPVNRP